MKIILEEFTLSLLIQEEIFFNHMSRIDRKSFLIEVHKTPGMYDLMDGVFQGLFRLGEEDTNHLLNSLTDEDVSFLSRNFKSFTDKKKLINWLNDKAKNLLI
jgi:hypothetical protein